MYEKMSKPGFKTGPLIFCMNSLPLSYPGNMQPETHHSYMLPRLHLQHKMESLHGTQPCGKYEKKQNFSIDEINNYAKLMYCNRNFFEEFMKLGMIFKDKH